jgi:hypothetical protein
MANKEKEDLSIEGTFLRHRPPSTREEGPSKNVRIGRKRGRKDKITALKIVAEQVARSRNQDKMQGVIDQIIEDARWGDKPSQKLVWDAIMTKGYAKETVAPAKVVIEVNSAPVAKERIIEAEVKIVPTFPEGIEPEETEEVVPDER